MLDSNLEKLITEVLSGQIDISEFENIDNKTWYDLFDFAAHQGLSIIVYDILKRNGIALPESITEKMKNVCYNACVSNAKRKKQLKDIIRLFNNNGIEHILLKGAALINTVYEDSICRAMCDFDILVKDKDGNRAFDLLIKHGYKSIIASSEEADIFKEGFYQHYPQLKKADSLIIELHTCFSDSYNTNPDEIWNRSKTINTGNLKTRVMSYEDMIIHIALHKFIQHGCMDNSLLGLYDIFLIVKTGRIDWNTLKLLTCKDEYNDSKCLYIALELIRTLLKINIDSRFLALIKPENISKNTMAVFKEFLFLNSSGIDSNGFKLGYYFYNSKYCKSTVAKGLFLNPPRMALYGKYKYGKGDLTFINLNILYLKRIATLAKRYIGTFTRQLFFKKNNNYSVELGKKAAELKYWLQNG
ncbi:MAG: nucleotidyltransferase family protein [Victivallaceae bacterium]|nr:nucleotidyltransferase family protein [Victivallaceae bacterium]